MPHKVLITTKRLSLIQTCSAYPEQYDCVIGRRPPNGALRAGLYAPVAYLRLRHHHFTVNCPDVGGDRVVDGMTWGDGEFYDRRERVAFLRAGLEAVHRWLIRNRPDDYLLGCDILPQ